MKTEHYYSQKQTSEFRPSKINMKVYGQQTEMYTAAGVFSKIKLDTGTKLLIESCVVEDGWKVLDLGCGYGVVGVMIKKQRPDVEVVMSDVNSRAVKLSDMNAKLHKVKVEVVQSDVFGKLKGRVFDTVLLNPPQTAGKDVCHQMITEAKEHLNKKGLLQLVARHNKGGKMLSEKMKEVFGNVKDIAKRSGFRLYVSEVKQ